MKCLSAVSNRDDVSANVIVTNSQLIAALVKLLLNGLAKFFPVQNVYSSSKVGKVGRVLILGILTDCTHGRFFKGCNLSCCDSSHASNLLATQLIRVCTKLVDEEDLGYLG